MKSASVPALAARFHFLQFSALRFSKVGRDFSMRLCHEFMYALARVSSFLFELRSRFFDDWRDLGDLFRRQVELGSQTFAHPLSDYPMARRFGEKVARMRCTKEGTRHSAGNEDEQKASYQFPLQREVHCGNSD